MKAVIEERNRGQQQLHTHEFYRLMHSEHIPLERKLQLAPIMSIFVMNFRDMNKWVIRFQQDDPDLYQRTINGNTIEDETHSRLFLEDWRKMHLDDKTGWQASDVIAWFFLAPETEDFRRLGVEFIRLCIDDEGDPFVRFAHSEIGEACGNVFFSHISPMAEELTQKTGLVYRYFGHFHLDLEDGHVLESEKIFEQTPLSSAQRARAIALVQRMFRIFGVINDNFAAYVKKYLANNSYPAPKFALAVETTAPSEVIETLEMIGAPPARTVNAYHPTQQKLIDILNERKAQAQRHPFYDWLTADSLAPKKKLLRFIPLWVVDIMGYRDLNKYVLHYPQPQNDAERLLNQLSGDLGTHSRIFLDDWIALDLDRLLRFTASDMMGFMFLNYYMDTHRKNLTHFAQQGLTHTSTNVRFWFMNALEASGHAFFAHTKVLAEATEREHGIQLNYLANRHSSTGNTAELQTAVDFFYQQTMSEQEINSSIALIHLVFDALNTNLDLSLQAAKENIFAIR